MTRKRNRPPVVETLEIAVQWEGDPPETTAVWTPSPDLLRHAGKLNTPKEPTK